MILVLVSLLAISVVFTGSCGGRETTAQLIENLTPQETLALIQDNQDNPGFVIIDVRTSEEFANAHIEDAINIDYYQESFRDELEAMDRNKTYLIYCRTGNRSQSAISIMGELGFKTIYHLQVGITGWDEEGLPTVK